MRIGAAFETVDDCRHDIAAWLDWMRTNVGPDVMLLGHSLGAVKCLYAAAHDPQAAPVRLIVQVEPITERFIRVIDTGTERLITVIEFISPTNKRGSGLADQHAGGKDQAAAHDHL